eukprot:gnl/Dysnectes_brevis/1346_a1511_2814.p1 GENE.gnl/Dysnectes_brevis/1346_a1511_2814~~gnl/Dysnectes_brevis/1346_a1511_2814.p1  ORF type:complete len:442 (+),score=126.54 gnl/Dysnectes_brevis/1346_a1511_2814:20-1345(+)
MTSIFWILNLRGKHVISRDYRGDVPSSALAPFVSRVVEGEDEPECGYIAPIFSIDGVVYAFVKTNSLYFVSASRSDMNCFVMIEFLERVAGIIKSYFGKVDEETIQDNFTLVYELLDEIMDYGYPQTTEASVLKEFIAQRSAFGSVLDRLARDKKEAQQAPPAVTGVVSWRKEGIKYRKNEIFLDVVEDVDMVVSPEGKTLSGSITGRLKMTAQLSGMPDLKLGLNDKVRFDRAMGREAEATKDAIDLEDVKLHQCVRLSQFEHDRTISFVPPDGEFELMSYRISSPSMRPVISCSVQETTQGSRTSLSFLVKLRTNFRAKSIAKEIIVRVPVPSDADTPRFKATVGSAKYRPSAQVFEWAIKQLGGKQQATLQAGFGLPSVRDQDSETSYSKSPVQVQFQVPYFSLSGIQIRYLRVHDKSGYEAVPWVRYLSSGTITIRR